MSWECLLNSVKISLCVVLVCFACGKDKRDTLKPDTPRSNTDFIDSSNWKVTKKSCGKQPQILLGMERFQFESGLAAHVFQQSQDQGQICNNVNIYNRVIREFRQSDNTIVETSILSPQLKRIVCRDRASNKTVSDETHSLSGTELNLKLDVFENRGQIELTGSTDCQYSTFYFEIERLEKSN